MDLFELNGRVVVNLADALKAFDEIQKHGQQTESKMSKVFSAVGKGAAAVGKAVGAGMVAAGTAMAGLTVKALNLSGELEQNMGGSEQVFKEYANSMQETARNAFSNMGLSTSDFLATANKMGALFQGAGFSIQESADLSAEAMQRAADVASIMGIDTSAAMEAIAGAAKGNFTMMDNLGVAMNDTTLQAYALEKGINKTTQEMTNQEKIGLAMEMFMEKTAYAAGNYARENETLAGSLGTAKAALTNFLDGSGNVDQLVTAFTNATTVIIDNVAQIAPRLVSGITDVVNQIIPMIPPLMNQLLPVIIEGATSLINGLVAAMPALIGGIMACLPALIDGLTQIINAVIQALPQLMEMIVSALPALIPALVDGVASMIVTLASNLPDLIQPIIGYLPEIIVAIVTALLDNLPQLVEAGGNLLLGLLEGMVQAMASIPEVLLGIFEAIEFGLRDLFGIHSPSTVMMEIGKNIIQGLINGIQNLLSGVTKLWDNLKTSTMNVWNGIKSAVSSVVNGIQSTVSGVFNSVKSTVSSIWNTIKSTISDAIDGAKDAVKRGIDAIKGFFNFKISWPHIPMPHFAISPSGWKIGDLLKGSIPKLSIDWYAKAMNNPMIMTDPTVFGYNPATGSLMAGGESGSEVVSGTNTLMNMIGDAVERKTGEQTERIIAVLVDLLDATVNGNQDLLKATMADRTFSVGEREFGRLVKAYAR